MPDIDENIHNRLTVDATVDVEKYAVILFDGDCMLCNKLITFVLKRSKDIFFAPLLSPVGKNILKQFDFPVEQLNTLVFIEKEGLYVKSNAVLRIVRKLNGLWPVFYVFIIVPVFIRDKAYDIIAKNRQKWFGTSKHCQLSNLGIENKFL